MGTTTAILHCGVGHPYDQGLWGEFVTLRLIEGDRCAWVTSQPHKIWLAAPDRMFLDGLRAISGEYWEDFPKVDSWHESDYKESFRDKRIVLSILAGSSLKADACRSRVHDLGIDGEILSGESL